jgi:hypothetical protein
VHKFIVVRNEKYGTCDNQKRDVCMADSSLALSYLDLLNSTKQMSDYNIPQFEKWVTKHAKQLQF